ncbi:hypothetical protein E8E14_011691 [Neopestalotiopsis sp. 37M]|nr:hypothetical protein E8E14_011691 [Neopestalotiopsis sp. 37M]
MFRAIITDLSQTFVVIDALDELEAFNNDEQRLLQGILQLQVDLQFNLFATSRFMPYITRLFRHVPMKEVRAERDISVYLDSRMSRLPECVRDSPKLQRRIKFHIEQAADGIFLLANRLFVEWTERSSVVDIETALISQEASFSVLRAAWNDPIQRFVEPGEWDSLAASALMWIIYAQWPMTASMLQHALAIQLHGDDKNLLSPDKIPSLEDILSACAGFLSIESGTGIVNIVHASAKEFLVQSQWFPRANEIIAETCTRYLCLEHFATGHVQSDGELQERFQSFPLYAYACCNWGLHAQLASKTAELVAQHFAKNTAHVQAWHQAIFRYSSGSKRADEVRETHWNVNVLQIAAFLNLECLIDSLISKYETDVEVKDSQSRTALSYAAEGGSKRAVKKLIALGAEIQAKDQDGATPLSWALRHRQDAVVRFLLKRDTRLEASNTVDNQEELILASQSGLLRSVEWLLAKGTDPDAQDKDHRRTPLMWAVLNGHKEVVQALLDEEVRCELKDPFGQTALSLASRMGFEPIVRLLIEFDADCKTKDKHGQQPLWWAAKQGHDGIVKLLIDEGVDIEAKDGIEHRSALSLAAEGGYMTIIQLLLRRNADQESSSVARQTPLFFAAAAGHVEVVKLLLDSGVDPQPRDVFDKTPKDRAILSNHKVIQSYLEIAEKSTSQVPDKRFGGSTGGTSIFLDSWRDAGRTRFYWEHDEPNKKVDSIPEWLERNASLSLQDEMIKSSLRKLLLPIGGVKQKMVRFMFDYDDNEHRNGLYTTWHAHNETMERQDTLSYTAGPRITFINPKDDLYAPMVVTTASVDANEIFGFQPGTPGKPHSTGHCTEVNLFQQVNDILLDSVQANPPGHPRRIRSLCDIGMIHVSKYQETESLDILKEAISSTRQALKELRETKTKLQSRDAASPPQYCDIQVILLANLGIQLEHLYRVTAQFAILDEAIMHIRLAISATSRQIERYRLIHVLGIQLRDRYAKMGDRMDLEEAIRLTQEAVDSSPSGLNWDLSRIAMLNNLASLLSDRFAETGDNDDRKKALEIMKEALNLGRVKGMNDHARAAILNNLGSIHADTFSQTRQKSDLKDAIDHAQKASDIVADTSTQRTQRAMILSHYAMLLGIQHRWFSQEPDCLKDFISSAREATDVAQDLPEDSFSTTVLYNIGSLHLYKFLEFRRSHDLDEAVRLINKGIDGTLKVHTDLRMIFNHPKTRFGSQHPTMGVLDITVAVMTRPQWYLQVSGSGEIAHVLVPNAAPENGGGVAAGNAENTEELPKVMFNACGTNITITEEVIEGAARNVTQGAKVMEILFKHGSQKSVPTDAVIRAAAKNEITGSRTLLVLLNRCMRGFKRKRASIDRWRN